MITINHLKKAFGNTVACDIEKFKTKINYPAITE